MEKVQSEVPALRFPGFKDAWRSVRLLDTVTIANGQVDPKLAPYRTYPLVAPNHIESETGRIIEYETAEQQNAISGKYLVEKDDVIYSKIRPGLRKAAMNGMPSDRVSSS